MYPLFTVIKNKSDEEDSQISIHKAFIEM